MFIRIKPISNSSRKRVQICACHRIGGKVKQKVVRHVGIAENDSQLEELKQLAEILKSKIREEKEGPFLFDIAPKAIQKEAKSHPDKTQETQKSSSIALTEEKEHFLDVRTLKEESRVIDGFHDIFGVLFNELGFHKILGKSQSDVLRDVVLARIACPSSKKATQNILAADFGKEIELDRIYRMMDALLTQKEAVQKMIFNATEQLCFGKIDLLLFDVTTLYFESVETDELRAFGYSKDQQFQSVQVVLALATAQNGLPIGYQLFPGNTAEVSTLLRCLEEWKKTLPIGRVRFVADRAMMSEANLQYLEDSGIEYIVAAKLKKQPECIKKKILSSEKAKNSIVVDESCGKRRLIVSFSLERQDKDKKDRKRLITKIDKKIGKGKSAKGLVYNSGYRKYLSCEGDAKLKVDEDKIAKDEAWDGYHGVITNCLEEKADDLLSDYKRLWIIEESFRIQKHNLSIRPIYHFKPERIEAHILICYMAFALMRHLEHRMRVQKETISMLQMRDVLWRVQSSYLKDEQTGKRYRLPSNTSVEAKKLYQAMGIKRHQNVQVM